MTLLSIGLLLWMLPHLFKRTLPRQRARMGPQARAMVAGLVGLSVVLMVIGYRMADVVPLYTPLPGMGHANNTLMLISGLSVRGGRVARGAGTPDAPSDAVGRGALGGGASVGEWRSGLGAAVWRDWRMGGAGDGADQPRRAVEAAENRAVSAAM